MTRTCPGGLAVLTIGVLLSGCGVADPGTGPATSQGQGQQEVSSPAPGTTDVTETSGSATSSPDGSPLADGSSGAHASPGASGAESSPPPLAGAGGPAPAGPIARFTCGSPTVQVSSADQLTAALGQASAGQVIRLADGVYTGTFVITASGIATDPIELCGGRGAIIDGGSVTGGYALHFDGAAHWRVSGFTVRNGQKGVMVDSGSNIGLQDLLVENIGDEAVHLRKNSTGNVVRGLTIRETGKRREKFGEGIYIGTAQSNWKTITAGLPDNSDHNFILENTISATTAEAVDIKEGTTGGVLAGNTFDGSALDGADSWVDVKGNSWQIIGNTGRVTPKDGFQTHVIVKGWGDHNVFTGNSADLAGGSGVGLYLHETLDNRIECSNKVIGGRLTNAGSVRCSG